MRSRHLSPARFAGPDASAPPSPPFPVLGGELGWRDGWPRCGRVACRRHGLPVRIRPLPFLPLSSAVGGLAQVYQRSVCEWFRRSRAIGWSKVGAFVWVSGLSGCRAAALAAGGATFVGGACVSGAGRQTWPRGWRGCGRMTELRFIGGV